MDVGKLKSSRRKKKLICRLNNLCFGMHGHLTALLKDFHYFFYLKRQGKYEIANVYLKNTFFELQQIILLSRHIENLGGFPKVLSYKNNQIDYYKIKNSCKIDCKVIVLDSISNQLLILKEYLGVKELTFDKKTEELIDSSIENIKNHIRLLSENITENTLKMPNL
ncbi:MAG: hypothetical protein J6V71_01625 [Clostridia bacterium]|nr:hypothetical protein [Clostridia bacterium]